MAEPAFDTLTIAKELERDYGFEMKQAEGAAVMIHRHLVGNVATKHDLRQLKDQLVAQLASKEEIENLATKEEIAKLATKEEIGAQGRELTGKIVALDEKVGVQIAALDEKIGAQGRELTGKIVAVEDRMLIEFKWIKLIGGVIVAVLVLPWFRDLVLPFLN